MWKRRRARKRSEPKELVLGEEQAEARRAETVHRAGSDGAASSLVHARYEQQAELSLLRLVAAQADSIISEVANRYRDAGASGRNAITASLTMDDYTITSFARRSAARALVSSQHVDLADALTA